MLPCHMACLSLCLHRLQAPTSPQCEYHYKAITHSASAAKFSGSFMNFTTSLSRSLGTEGRKPWGKVVLFGEAGPDQVLSRCLGLAARLLPHRTPGGALSLGSWPSPAYQFKTLLCCQALQEVGLTPNPIPGEASSVPTASCWAPPLPKPSSQFPQ